MPGVPQSLGVGGLLESVRHCLALILAVWLGYTEAVESEAEILAQRNHSNEMIE